MDVPLQINFAVMSLVTALLVHSITQYNCTGLAGDTGFAAPKANAVEQQ